MAKVFYERITPAIEDALSITLDSFADRLSIDYRLHTLAQQYQVRLSDRIVRRSLAEMGKPYDNFTFLDLGCGDGLQTAIFIRRMVTGKGDAPRPLMDPRTGSRNPIELNDENLKEWFYREHTQEVRQKLDEIKDYIEATRKMKPKGVKVIGLEGCPAMVEEARNTGLYDELLPQKYHENLGERSIDFAVCFSASFGHCLRLSDARKSIEDMYNALVPGGFLFISTLYGHDDTSFSRTWRKIQMPAELEATPHSKIASAEMPAGISVEKSGNPTYTTRMRLYSFNGFRELARGFRITQNFMDLDNPKRIIEVAVNPDGRAIELFDNPYMHATKPLQPENLPPYANEMAQDQIAQTFYSCSDYFMAHNRIMKPK